MCPRRRTAGRCVGQPFGRQFELVRNNRQPRYHLGQFGLALGFSWLGCDDDFAFGCAADGLVAGTFLAGVFGAGLLAFFICSTPRASDAAFLGAGGF
jgi:hypothetical protein